MKATYTMYKNEDMSYFMGHKTVDKASKEYLNDFGELKQIRDVRKALKKDKKYELL